MGPVLRKQRGTLTTQEAGRAQEGWCCFHSSIFATPFIDSDQRLSFLAFVFNTPVSRFPNGSQNMWGERSRSVWGWEGRSNTELD